ncbi:MAG: hypothetical protein WCY19_00735 [Candidatus Gastranaerophilaceae bacterium]
MTLNPISAKVENKKGVQPALKDKNVSFRGFWPGTPIVGTMDAIDRGGVAASFLTQDVIGMWVPRIKAGLHRNEEETGQRNYRFAATEAIREVISGPSTFFIPAALLWVTRKYFGSANEVPVDYIKGLGDDFAEFAKNQDIPRLIKKGKLKEKYYRHAIKNMLKTSTNGGLDGVELDKKVLDYTKRILEIEHAHKKNFFKRLFAIKQEDSREDLFASLSDDFVSLRKKHTPPNEDVFTTKFKTEAQKPLEKGLNKFLHYLKNYSNDVTSSLAKKRGAFEIGEYIKNFNVKRMGSRFITNMTMIALTSSFFVFIPKLYKHKDGVNPGLNGLNGPKSNPKLEGGQFDEHK